MTKQGGYGFELGFHLRYTYCNCLMLDQDAASLYAFVGKGDRVFIRGNANRPIQVYVLTRACGATTTVI
jgi:hypothetical protein